MINLIHQGTSPIVQEQNGLPLVARSVEIGEKSRTNRGDVENQVRQGGWAVAFGRELTETDLEEGAVAAGVSIFTDNPGPVLAWLDELISQSLAQMGTSIATTFAHVARQQAEQFAKGVITSLLQGRNDGEK
ncbi:MAG: hypothetical protein JO034_31000, partial [Singulisphaera sp.]|nr:hypothetical protein [Singulisphaera sp.]